ncbi:MAG: hypothetical protein IPJ88_18960 [Myxococcales bacterium]|nr:MAG: hypothetical protein IPJ88_18960 [Myxococcales bacterium]
MASIWAAVDGLTRVSPSPRCTRVTRRRPPGERERRRSGGAVSPPPQTTPPDDDYTSARGLAGSIPGGGARAVGPSGDAEPPVVPTSAQRDDHSR